MPDLKNKYSDPELNPSNKAFDEIINQPDMQALNDQGDAIARDLENSEEGLKAPENYFEGDSKDAARRAEAKEWNAPENRFNYQKPDPQSQGKSGWSRRRKILTGAGVGGGGVGIMAIILMLLPLKIPGIMQMIANEAGQRVEQITERRAKIILGRAIVSKFASNSGVVITGNGAVATLIASMRTNGFEKRLAAKGLTIEKSGDGVKLRMNNKLIGDGKTLRTDIEVLRALEGNNLSNKMLKEVIKEDIPSWRWMKRAKFAKWLRIKYGIPRYGLKNSDNADSEKRVSEMQTERMRTELGALSNDIGEATECILTVDCDVDTQGEGRPEDLHQSGDAGAIADSVDGTVEEVVENNSKPGSIQKTLITTVLDKLGSKAIPIVGWIDLLATADHIAYEATENDYFGKLASYYRANQYARHYGTWEGYGSQIQLGAMDPSFISVLAKQTEGIEEAQAFSYIQGDASKGKPVEKIAANSESDYAEQLKELRALLAPGSNLPGVQESTHFVLNLYYESLGGGGLLGWLSDKIGGFLASLASTLTPDSFEEWFGKLMVKVGGKLFEMLGLDFDPGIKGADWFNAAHGGATWTYNDFCQNEMGCRKLTPEQTSMQNAAIAAERAEYGRQQGWVYALFSTDSTTSVTSQLAIHAPTSVASLLSNIGRMVTNTPATLAGLTTNKTSATAYVDIHGVDPYGATSAELDKPVDPRAISGEACDETFDGKELDLCQTDTMVAEAMLCEFEPDSADCSENDAAEPGTGEGVEFTVASYNILHSESHPGPSNDIGGCNTNPVPGDPVCTKTRTARQVKIITGQMGNPVFDLVGTQETSPEQYNLLKSSLTGYSVYPDNTSRLNNKDDGAVAIFWNNSKFTKFAEGKAPGISNTAKAISNPWVGLQTTSGHKVYAMSIHYAQNACSDGNCSDGTPQSVDDENMRKSSNLTMDWVRSKVSDDSIVVVMGDFNDQLNQKLSYCIYTKDSVMQHAVDMEAGASPSKGCNANRFGGIDHIYATPKLGITVSDWKHMANTGEVAKASDHTPVYARYTIPGAEGGGASFRISSFNIYYSTNKSDPQYSIKEWPERLARSVSVIKNNNLDVVGLQEVRENQWQRIQAGDMLGGTYDIFPKPYGGGSYPGQNPIIWRNDKFTLMEGKAIPGYTVTSGRSTNANTQVKLKSKETGQEFYVINHHEPVGAGDAIKQRYDSAKERATYVKNLGDSGLPVFLTGDFNSGYNHRPPQPTYQGDRNNLAYCIFTDNNLLWDAYDAAASRQGKCPTTSDRGVDHIFMSTSVTAKNYDYSISPRGNGSDVHNTLFVDVTIPGENTDISGWVWPIQQDLKPGPCWNVNVGTLGKHAGMDINTDNENNPALAMHAGTITRTGYDTYAGNYVKVKTTSGMYYIYQHLKSIEKRSGSVRAGEKLGVAGKTGRMTISSKAHFHVVVSKRDDFPSYGDLQGSIDPLSVLPRPAPGGYACTR